MRIIPASVLLLLVVVFPLWGGAFRAGERVQPAERVAVLVPIGAESSWLDDAFLAAVPAAAVLGNGEPIVLSVDQAAPWRPELLDFLKRYDPSRLLWVGPKPVVAAPVELAPLELLPAARASQAAAALAALAWQVAEQVVFFDPGDRAAALSASALAARWAHHSCPAGPVCWRLRFLLCWRHWVPRRRSSWAVANRPGSMVCAWSRSMVVRELHVGGVLLVRTGKAQQ